MLDKIKQSFSKFFKTNNNKSEIDEKVLKKIKAVNWSDFETAYGNADKTIPKYLKNIYSKNEKLALEATHQLWCSLCHQHAYISSASIPAYDIIKDRLAECNDKLKIELLDIMLGFASCSNHKTDDKTYRILTSNMKSKMLNDKNIFKKYIHNKNEDIKDFAELIMEHLENKKL